MANRYTTWGPVRGLSPIRHRTRGAAERELARDQRGCRAQGGYSDRTVAVVVGGRLYHDEEATAPVWPSSGRTNGSVRA